MPALALARKWSKMLRKQPEIVRKWSKHGLKWFKVVWNGLEFSEIVPWSKIVQYFPRWSKMVWNGPWWSVMIQYGMKWSKMVWNKKSCLKWSKIPKRSYVEKLKYRKKLIFHTYGNNAEGRQQKKETLDHPQPFSVVQVVVWDGLVGFKN